MKGVCLATEYLARLPFVVWEVSRVSFCALCKTLANAVIFWPGHFLPGSCLDILPAGCLSISPSPLESDASDHIQRIFDDGDVEK